MVGVLGVVDHGSLVKPMTINYTVLEFCFLVIDVSGVMVSVLGVVDHGSLVKPMTINYTVLEFCSL